MAFTSVVSTDAVYPQTLMLDIYGLNRWYIYIRSLFSSLIWKVSWGARQRRHFEHFKQNIVSFCLTAAQICSLPVETGRCFAAMKRFFFNSTSRRCEEFIFGGCEGNLNRFDTEKDCFDFCGCKWCLELSQIVSIGHVMLSMDYK